MVFSGSFKKFFTLFFYRYSLDYWLDFGMDIHPPPTISVHDVGVVATAEEPFFPVFSQKIRSFLPEALEVDADTFQFKVGRDVDQYGVSAQLRSVKIWQPQFAGTVFVWERRDGTFFIVNGHQRRGLALRLQKDPYGRNISLNAWVGKESDGWTPIKARIMGALINLAEGGESTKSIHIAMLLRDGCPPSIFEQYISRARTQYRYGVDIAKLEPGAFARILNEEYPERYGAAVGQMITGEQDQIEALRVIAHFRPNTEGDLFGLAASIREHGFATEQMSRQQGLFEDEEAASKSIFFTYVRLLNDVLRGVAQDARWASATTKRPDIFHEIAGAPPDMARFAQAAEILNCTHRVLKKLMHQKGDIADLLQDSVRALYQKNTDPTPEDIRQSAQGLIHRLRHHPVLIQMIHADRPPENDLITQMDAPQQGLI